MIISNKDRNRLLSLLERYGYEKVSKFNVLNEAYKSDILATLETINSKPHVGLSGAAGRREEKPLSPVGAAFMKAFPIPWHLITDDQIKIYCNGNLSKYMPVDGRLYGNKINLTKNPKTREAYGKIQTGLFVSEDLDETQKNINKLRNDINKLIKDIAQENTEFANSIGTIDDGHNDGAWIDATKKLSKKYRDNKNGAILDWLVLTTLSKFLNFVGNAEPVTKSKDIDDLCKNAYDDYADINKLSKKYVFLKTANNIQLVKDAKELYDRFVNEDTDEVTRYGIVGYLRIAKTSIEGNTSIDMMIKPSVNEVLEELVNAGYISYSEVEDFLGDYYDGNEIIEDISIFARQFNMYYKEQINDDRDKINEIYKTIVTAYKSIKNKKKGNFEEYTIYKNLYNNVIKYGDNNAAKVATIADDIKTWYSNFKSKYKYSLAILLDKHFKILYIFSCISFGDELMNKVNTRAIYGWKDGDRPQEVITELSGLEGKSGYEINKSKDEHNNEVSVIKIKKRSGEKTVYNYNEIDADIIKNDENVAIAIIIDDNNKTDFVKPESLNAYNQTVINYLTDINITRQEDAVSNNKIEINEKNADKARNLLNDAGIEYNERTNSSGKVIFDLILTDDNINKIENIYTELKSDEKSYIDIKPALTNYLKWYTKLSYFDPEYAKPKEFGLFYDRTLNNKVNFEHYVVDDENPEYNEIKEGRLTIALYGSDNNKKNKYGYNTQDILDNNNKKSLYQYYIGNSKDSKDARILFDSFMTHPHYENILNKYIYAKKELGEVVKGLSSDIVFNFDIKNEPGVIFSEQIRRLNRVGRVRKFSLSNEEKGNEYDYNIVNKKVFKNGTGIFNTITEKIINKAPDFIDYPFKTRENGAKYDNLKKTVRNTISTLIKKNGSNKEKEYAFNIATSIYNDYMNIMNEFDNSDIIKNGTIDDAAKYVSTTLTDFYNKYSDYFVK